MKTIGLLVCVLAALILTACVPETWVIPPAENEGSTQTLPPSPTASAPRDPVITLVAPSGEVDLRTLTPQVSGTQDPVEMPSPGIPDPGKQMANMVMEALAEELDVDISAVQLIDMQRVEWSDSSLGCPSPGFAYLTVITPGYRIVLEVNQEQYTYHTNTNNLFIRCNNGRPVP